MLREKSCGIVPFREVDGEIRYLVISSAVTKREHWEFPKGGVEKGEREIETALRELEEETGVSDVELLPGYREPIRYIYRRQEGLVFKQVIYFIGRVGDPTVKMRPEEVKDYRWATYDEARTLLRHGNAKELLYRCHAFIQGKPLPARGPIGRRPPKARGGGERSRREDGEVRSGRPRREEGEVRSGRNRDGAEARSGERPRREGGETRAGAPQDRSGGTAPARERDREAAGQRGALAEAAPNGEAQQRRPRRRRRRRRPRGQAGGGGGGGTGSPGS